MSEAKNVSRAQQVERGLLAASRLDDEQLFAQYRTDPDG